MLTKTNDLDISYIEEIEQIYYYCYFKSGMHLPVN